MRIAICDDDREARSGFRTLLAEAAGEQAQRFSLEEYDAGEALCVAARSGALPDLIFLDIYMDGMNGMETAKTLRAAGCDTPIVFLTTTADFALESYEVTAFSYLLKPVTAVKLAEVMDRFWRSYRPRSVLLQGRLYVLGDIVSAESRNKTVIFHFKNGTAVQMQERLDVVAQQLTGRNFLRCHQSFIVNMDYIKAVGDSVFITRIGTEVLIRKREFALMRKTYYDYLASL